MYNDEIWGRSGPHAVITITEPVKGTRLRMVDEIKRALEDRRDGSVPVPDPTHGRGGRRVRHAQDSTRRSRALEELNLFARAAWKMLLENIPERAFERRAACCSSKS